ncbi:MAG: putative sulfate exporter family transporter [Comamonadaceae bacterium]|nr:putative sulfate exporter family transporter [Comamonadaceae bacterium]
MTAITALAPAIDGPNRDTAVAVANTVAFGTLGMLVYPYLFHSLCDGNSEQVGMCLGVAIHDTSQVLRAAMSYKETFDDEVVLQAAAVTGGTGFAVASLLI